MEQNCFWNYPNKKRKSAQGCPREDDIGTMAPGFRRFGRKEEQKKGIMKVRKLGRENGFVGT